MKTGDRVIYTNPSTRFPFLLGVPGTIRDSKLSCYIIKFDGHSNEEDTNGCYVFDSQYVKPYIESFIIEI